MSYDLSYVPHDLQHPFAQEPKPVCERAFKFLKTFKFVKIDKRNPILQFRPDLREALVIRRNVHKLFDLLKCPQWRTVLASNEITSTTDQLLVLRDCYLTFDSINNPD